jgi:hypothetical protein
VKLSASIVQNGSFAGETPVGVGEVDVGTTPVGVDEVEVAGTPVGVGEVDVGTTPVGVDEVVVGTPVGVGEVVVSTFACVSSGSSESRVEFQKRKSRKQDKLINAPRLGTYRSQSIQSHCTIHRRLPLCWGRLEDPHNYEPKNSQAQSSTKIGRLLV